MGWDWPHRVRCDYYCNAVIPVVDRHMDEDVYALYGLTEEEIGIVEGGVNSSG